MVDGTLQELEAAVAGVQALIVAGRTDEAFERAGVVTQLADRVRTECGNLAALLEPVYGD